MNAPLTLSHVQATVVNAVYPVPLKTFFRLFLADQSTFSQEIHTFQQDISKRSSLSHTHMHMHTHTHTHAQTQTHKLSACSAQ